ncbi:flagellar motor protein MotB [Advenella kashmirensis W13003]|uniref:Flagellar motor protein MotB n=1 Tax=Advenella kashmirensis W13003 TaxID=1424334 RepID=V8QS50_9BURK|nr:outer membrane protein assembly factor BamE [Advenella kashmirensis]ETF02135.1 flagellar motor protein MotB [Advenella kashmirensis W13003]
MKYSIRKSVMSASALVAAMVLSGCGSLSHVTSNGTTDTPVFPDPQNVTFNDKQGTFPNRDSLNEVKAGMTKDQLYYLLGRPHFQEGFFGVKEWDYLFHFHTPKNGKNSVATCQFKVLFDEHYRAQSFFMRAVGEPNEICTLGQSKKIRQFDLDTDGVFAFDKSDLRNLTSTGRARLDNLVRRIGQIGTVESIEITGYTDPLGSDAYNRALSQRRAQTVRQYLGSQGIPMERMTTRGAGATTAYAQCDRRMGKTALIACFAPNRRVTLRVTGAGNTPADK